MQDTEARDQLCGVCSPSHLYVGSWDSGQQGCAARIFLAEPPHHLAGALEKQTFSFISFNHGIMPSLKGLVVHFRPWMLKKQVSV